MAVRKVRTAAGQKRYDQPIGSIIVRDSVLKSLKVTGAPFKGWTRVKGTNGKEYDIGYDEDAKVWVALEPDTWDVIADEGDTEEEIFELLDKAVRKRGSNPTPEDPVIGTAVNKPAQAVKPKVEKAPNKPKAVATKKTVAKKLPAGKPTKKMTAPEKRAEAGRQARESRAAAKKTTPAKKTAPKKRFMHEFEHFGERGRGTTVVETDEGWFTRKLTGRVSAQGRVYQHVKKHSSHEDAVRYAKDLEGVKDERSASKIVPGPFGKGDRVTVTGMTGDRAKFNGMSGTVQQRRDGGNEAIVKLGNGQRVSVYQVYLRRAGDEPAKPTTAEIREVNKLPYERQAETYMERRKIGATHDEAMRAARNLIELEQGEPQYGTGDSDYGTPSEPPKPPKKASQARRRSAGKTDTQRMMGALLQAGERQDEPLIDKPPKTFDEFNDAIAKYQKAMADLVEQHGEDRNKWPQAAKDQNARYVAAVHSLRQNRGPGPRPTAAQRREVNKLGDINKDLYETLRSRNLTHDEAMNTIDKFGTGAPERRNAEQRERLANEQDEARGYQRNEYSDWTDERLARMLKATNLKPTARRKMEAEMRRRIDRRDREGEIRPQVEETGFENLSDTALRNSIDSTQKIINDLEKHIPLKASKKFLATRRASVKREKEQLKRMLAEQRKRRSK